MEAGIGVITIANGSDVVGDMAVEEGRVVMVEEESITITCSAGGEEARWTEMSTAGEDVATTAREVDDRVVETGGAKRGSNGSILFASSSWITGCSVVPPICLSLLEGEPPGSFLVYTLGFRDCSISISFLFLDLVIGGDLDVSPIEVVAAVSSMALDSLLSPSYVRITPCCFNQATCPSTHSLVRAKIGLVIMSRSSTSCSSQSIVGSGKLATARYLGSITVLPSSST